MHLVAFKAFGISRFGIPFHFPLLPFSLHFFSWPKRPSSRWRLAIAKKRKEATKQINPNGHVLKVPATDVSEDFFSSEGLWKKSDVNNES